MKTLASPRNRVTEERRFLTLATLGIGLVLAVFLYMKNPGAAGLPTCPLHGLTGFFCPGCGSLRAVHHLLHGDLVLALRHNLLAVLIMPLVGWLWIAESLSVWSTKPLFRPHLPAGAIWILLTVILAFGGARNLPLMPFELLAPPGVSRVQGAPR